MSRPFPQVYEGDEVIVDPKKEVYFMACCDCNMVHEIHFEIRGGKIVMRGFRDNRKTAALRRHRGVPIKDGEK